MAFKTFTAGAVLTASDVNTYLAKQAVVVCTSTTRPSSPPEGMVVYETDTDKMLAYTTATTGWVPPWNMPWGHVASATNTPTANVAMTAYTVVTLTMTGLAANRRLRFDGVVTSVGSPAITDPELTSELVVGGTAITSGATKQKGVYSSPGWYTNHCLTGTAVTGAGGSLTALVRLTLVGSNAFVGGCSLTVEDIGPNGAPA